MKAAELRQAYIEFFKRKQHAWIKSASLIPDNDPTVLFTTAGMHPLAPFLLGEPHPDGPRLVNCQKCLRTGDIDQVGDDVHLTFFEMLGNWSLGDYFKEEAIEYSCEFLTSHDDLDLPMNKLAISVFCGDDTVPFDELSCTKWRELGIPAERIAKLGRKHNWWGPVGQSGPCGPDTEMFYWTGTSPIPRDFDPNNPLWVEIWNDVFMQYKKTASGAYYPLEQRNVDTGMGLERVTAILQGKSSFYDTELFASLFDCLRRMRPSSDPRTDRHGRIIVEHLRSAIFILADGISPSNLDQGYVLRRLIRRAIRSANVLGIQHAFCSQLADIVVKEYEEVYPELAKHVDFIQSELRAEELQFSKTLKKGIREFNKIIAFLPVDHDKKIISGRKAFDLYETFGLPVEISKEMAKEKGFVLDESGFHKAYQKHREQSRKGAEKKFKGGLEDHSILSTRLHTATHLLHKALKLVLGNHVLQKGSNITAERLRFDFSHPQKMTTTEIHCVETMVNQQIQRSHLISRQEMSVAEAKEKGAIGLFELRYGKRVSVYTIGDFSMEICGGPHVSNTAELGHFKILKEESSSHGIRRIRAVLHG